MMSNSARLAKLSTAAAAAETPRVGKHSQTKSFHCYCYAQIGGRSCSSVVAHSLSLPAACRNVTTTAK